MGLKRLKRSCFLVVIFLSICTSYTARAAEKISVAAASDLKFAMDDICRTFKEINPDIEVGVSYGSSGNFFVQIKQGAPFDIFFSADNTYPKHLEEEGLAVRGTRELYAIGKIALWIPKKSKLNFQEGLEVLLRPEVKRLAIANPKHAPYGKAAEESLRYYGLWGKIQNKLIYGENISQTAQFVQAGAADAGLIALSLAISPKMEDEGRYWVIPTESYSRLEQAYIVLQRGKGKSSIKTFLEFVQGEKGKKILSHYGFVLPHTQRPDEKTP